MSHAPIRVLIVDDSAVVRGLLARALEGERDVVISGTAMHGEAALSALHREPADVVILDVEMPVMDGLTALPRILKEFPQISVIMASSYTKEGAGPTVKALALGAAGCIAKPTTNNLPESIALVSRELIPLIKACRQNFRVSRPTPAALVPTLRALSGRFSAALPTPTILVVAASTGGPNALSVLVKGLSHDFPLPILIVQHMPATFTGMLSKHLERDGGRPCAEAIDGEPIERGRTYVAPGDYHMEIAKRGDRMVIVLNQGPQEHYCRPSANPLFRTAAHWYGRGVLSAVLTGMGDDGIEGVRDIVSQGGRVFAQDEASCVVWGMPAAVVREGLAEEVLPLTALAPALLRAVPMETAAR